MFGKKKETRPGKANPKRDLSQFGIFDAPESLGGGGGDDSDDGDDDFEAELARITGGGAKKKAKPQPAAKPLVDMSDLDRMVAASLADVDTDADSEDENDPALLSELNMIADGEEEEEVAQSPPPASIITPTSPAASAPTETFLPTSEMDLKSVLRSRLEMYQQAEKNAKAAGDSTKARRFGRGIKTLQDQLKQANAGRAVNEEDIPPEVSVKPAAGKSNQVAPAPPESLPSPTTAAPIIEPTRSAPPVPEQIQRQAPSSPQDTALLALSARKEEYKVAAVQCKKNGEKENALKLVKILKLMDMAIGAVKEGQVIDLSEMPPPPEVYLEMEKNAPSEEPTPPPQPEPDAAPPPPTAAASTPEAPLVMATTIDGALVQRLEKYKSVEAAAKAEGNSSKARRFGRIVKQYEDAVKLYKAGKAVNYEELPTPPGFGPLPLGGASAAPPPVPARPKPSASSSPDEESTPSPAPGPSRPAAPTPPQANRASGNLANTTLMQKQIDELLKRQNEFKSAAIEAKKQGDLEEAKEYLRCFKGFDKLLETARGGFPVDMSTLPIPPGKRNKLEESFEVVTGVAIDEEGDLDCEGAELVDRLLEQLKKQLTMCKETRDHHRAMGDVPGTNKFENLALSVQKDIDVMKYVRRTKSSLPKYHYERKTFNVVKCHTDLTDNQLEVNIERGINYNVTNPKDVDTYVKFEFPWPQDEGTKGKTTVVKNTDNPEYLFKQTIDIQRNSKQCVRIFKRQAVKLEVYSDRGFLRSDQLIGTISVKLQPLENECEIHESYDIMNGRKVVGGKVEVKLRVRNPMLNKQIQKIDEKWLVIDN